MTERGEQEPVFSEGEGKFVQFQQELFVLFQTGGHDSGRHYETSGSTRTSRPNCNYKNPSVCTLKVRGPGTGREMPGGSVKV